MVLFALFLAACAGTREIPPDEQPASASRQAELTRMFDSLSVSEPVAKSAAKQAAAGDARDMRFLSSLWGTRSSDPIVARRLGDALSEARKHDEAIVWYQRAFLALEDSDKQRPYVRYDLARQYLALGKRKEALDVLANRLSLEPLPEDLKPKYDALITEASR